jgi:hypothetical protein
MTVPARDHAYLTNVTPDQVAALVFELASQLHVERQRRMALETLLRRQGVITEAALETLADDASFMDAARAELDHNLRRLLRIVTETGDPTGPLRAEAL